MISAMSKNLFVFPATGQIHRYVVPATGRYIIEASGAQSGASDRGARIRGTFDLNEGDVLHILVGQQKVAGRPAPQPDAGGDEGFASDDAWDHRPPPLIGGEDGGSYVWMADRTCPAQLMLAAGHDGSSFNAGRDQTNSPRMQSGDGCVSIIAESSCLAQAGPNSVTLDSASLRNGMANPESICLFGNLQRALHPGFGQRRPPSEPRPD
jgi:hypothetical protein